MGYFLYFEFTHVFVFSSIKEINRLISKGMSNTYLRSLKIENFKTAFWSFTVLLFGYDEGKIGVF